jgi:NADH-quinone oxidoreductase subunit J
VDTINWHTFFFWLAALATCGFSLAVVLTTNVVRMAVYLIAALTGASGLFFLAGADFVGAMQLMIYVGGTLVLLIFGVMLTAQGPFINLRSRGIEWVLGLAIGACLLGVLLNAVLSVPAWRGPADPVAAAQSANEPLRTSTPIGLALLGARPDNPAAAGYLFPFEIVSVHLLVVLIGAAYLARTKKRASATSP